MWLTTFSRRNQVELIRGARRRVGLKQRGVLFVFVICFISCKNSLSTARGEGSTERMLFSREMNCIIRRCPVALSLSAFLFHSLYHSRWFVKNVPQESKLHFFTSLKKKNKQLGLSSLCAAQILFHYRKKF